ncbi:MAG: nucleotidyltransferase domain-containing protein [Candidatus Edwardsbacteria bacterium]
MIISSNPWLRLQNNQKQEGVDLEEAERNRIINILEDYFSKRDEVLMVFLLGSFSKISQCKESDIDIAVYFKPKNGEQIEWESVESRYEAEDEVWLELEQLLKREVDLIVLNRASSTVTDSAIRGFPVLIKDRRLYLNFMLRVSQEAEDYRNFVKEYWKLKQEIRGTKIEAERRR